MMLGLCATVLAAEALYFAHTIAAPLTLWLFAVALVWPLHRRLAGPPPAGLVTLCGLALLTAWLAPWVQPNSAQLQLLHASRLEFLAGQGVDMMLLTQGFDAGWLERLAQQVTVQPQGILSLTVVAIIFLVFGRLEMVRAQLARLPGETAPALPPASAPQRRNSPSIWPCAR